MLLVSEEAVFHGHWPVLFLMCQARWGRLGRVYLHSTILSTWYKSFGRRVAFSQHGLQFCHMALVIWMQSMLCNIECVKVCDSYIPLFSCFYWIDYFLKLFSFCDLHIPFNTKYIPHCSTLRFSWTFFFVCSILHVVQLKRKDRCVFIQHRREKAGVAE